MVSINDFWANLSVVCIAADPNNPQNYVCELVNLLHKIMFRSMETTNGGATWTQIFISKYLYPTRY